MKWSDLLALGGWKTRENEEPTDLEQRADSLLAAFPDSPDFVREHMTAGHTVAEAVAALKADHAAAVNELVDQHSQTVAAIAAERDKLAAQVTDLNARLAELSTLPKTDEPPPVPLTPTAAKPANKYAGKLSDGLARYAADLETKLPTKGQ